MPAPDEARPFEAPQAPRARAAPAPWRTGRPAQYLQLRHSFIHARQPLPPSQLPAQSPPSPQRRRPHTLQRLHHFTRPNSPRPRPRSCWTGQPAGPVADICRAAQPLPDTPSERLPHRAPDSEPATSSRGPVTSPSGLLPRPLQAFSHVPFRVSRAAPVHNLLRAQPARAARQSPGSGTPSRRTPETAPRPRAASARHTLSRYVHPAPLRPESLRGPRCWGPLVILGRGSGGWTDTGMAQAGRGGRQQARTERDMRYRHRPTPWIRKSRPDTETCSFKHGPPSVGHRM